MSASYRVFGTEKYDGFVQTLSLFGVIYSEERKSETVGGFFDASDLKSLRIATFTSPVV